MRMIALTCDHCGAPLEVPRKAEHVTCAYCETRLKVQQGGGAFFTEKIDSIDDRTRQIAEDVSAIRANQEMAELDREWADERLRYQVRGKDSELSVPTQAGAIIGMVAVVAFGIFWIGMATRMGAPAFFPIFGVIFILVALGGGVSVMTKAKQYGQRQHEYMQHRQQLQQRLRDRD